MWNLLQTSLAAIGGAYIYIKPPLHPSESPHYCHAFWRSDKKASCSSGFGRCPAPPCVCSPADIADKHQIRHLKMAASHPSPTTSCALPLSSSHFLPARTPSVTCGTLPRWAWLPLRRERDRSPRPSFLKDFSVFRVFEGLLPSVFLPLFLPLGGSQGFVYLPGPFSSLQHLHSICQRASTSAEAAFVWSWVEVSHTRTA